MQLQGARFTSNAPKGGTARLFRVESRLGGLPQPDLLLSLPPPLQPPPPLPLPLPPPPPPPLPLPLPAAVAAAATAAAVNWKGRALRLRCEKKKAMKEHRRGPRTEMIIYQGMIVVRRTRVL